MGRSIVKQPPMVADRTRCKGEPGKAALFVSDRMSAFGQLIQECGGPLWVDSR